PRGICLATVFNWLRHRNEAPKSALHFGPGRYRLYWNRFHIGTGSRYTSLLIMAIVTPALNSPPATPPHDSTRLPSVFSLPFSLPFPVICLWLTLNKFHP